MQISPHEPPHPSTLAAPLHALIIEDDLITGLDLQAMLQGLGYASFAFASTVLQAKEQALLKSPDLTTVDLGLLHGDGVAAVEAVESVCGPVAAIFITGHPEGVPKIGPGKAVLSKPVTALDLRRALAATGREPKA
jgi:CheY-like chemotaxis protein